jgi:prepilin-type N-terminal cleavage/methylation domain-containing protein
VTRRERGFTLVELMIALVISSLLVGLLLSIFVRISTASRGQQQVATVQQVLNAARSTLEADAKQAGLLMSQGFTLGSTGSVTLHSPVKVIDSSTGPDQVAFYYADTSVQAAVPSAAVTATKTACDVDSTTGFAVNDLVVMSTASQITNPLNPGVDANIATFQACVLRISAMTGTQLTFTTAAPWGSAGNTHCSNIPLVTPAKGTTMFFKLVANHYRIDPARPADGALQVSPTGNLVGLTDWQDLAYGFTDLQVATRFFDGDFADTADTDTDTMREWYSGTMQQTLTQSGGPFTPPIQISISLVARTDRDVEGIATAATPLLSVAGNANNNSIGNHDSVALPSASNTALQGNRIYRYTTLQTDLRNIGVGR